jgi:hypothetical protein
VRPRQSAHAQHRKLRYLTAGAEHRHFFAEQRGDLALEVLDERACAGLGSVLRKMVRFTVFVTQITVRRARVPSRSESDW